MKRFFRGAEGILCVVLTIVLLIGLAGVFVINNQIGQLPVFRDVTMELGGSLPTISQFLTELGDPNKATLVTPAEEIDLTRVGQQQLTFRQNGKEETVTLTIRDTQAPVVTFRCCPYLGLSPSERSAPWSCRAPALRSASQSRLRKRG